MNKKDSKATLYAPEFQIIFEKLEEAKIVNTDLFEIVNSEELTLSDSIREIKKIVDSYSIPTTVTTFTKA